MLTYVRVTDHSFKYGCGLVPPMENGAVPVHLDFGGGEKKRVRTCVTAFQIRLFVRDQ